MEPAPERVSLPAHRKRANPDPARVRFADDKAGAGGKSSRVRDRTSASPGRATSVCSVTMPKRSHHKKQLAGASSTCSTTAAAARKAPSKRVEAAAGEGRKAAQTVRGGGRKRPTDCCSDDYHADDEHDSGATSAGDRDADSGDEHGDCSPSDKCLVIDDGCN